jgi:hypothetical protein
VDVLWMCCRRFLVDLDPKGGARRMGATRHHVEGPSLMSIELRVDAEAFVEIIAHLEDLAERMRGDREMLGQRDASNAEDHLTYLIQALQEITPDALTDHYSIRRIQKAPS